MLRRPALANPAARLGLLIRPLLTIVEVIIGLRVIFRVLGSRDTGVVTFIYRISDPLVSPWRGLASDSVNGSHVVEWSSIIAMVVYAVAAALVIRMLLRASRV